MSCHLSMLIKITVIEQWQCDLSHIDIENIAFPLRKLYQGLLPCHHSSIHHHLHCLSVILVDQVLSSWPLLSQLLSSNPMLSLSLFLFFPLVSPELLGVLSSIAFFMAVIALFFLYLSSKLSVESPSSDLPHFEGFNKDLQGKYLKSCQCVHCSVIYMAVYQIWRPGYT